MAKVPRFFANPQVRSGSVGVNVNQGTLANLQVTGLEGRGSQELGRTLEAVGRQKSDEAESIIESNYITNSVTNFELDAAENFEKLKADPNFVENFRSSFDASSQSLLSNAPTERAAAKINSRIGSLKVRFENQIRKESSALNKANRLLTTNNTLERVVRLSKNNPNLLSTIEDNIRSLTSQLGKDGLSKEQIDQVRNTSLNKARSSALAGLINSNPSQAKQMLKTMDSVDSETRTRLENSINKSSERNIVQTIDTENEKVKGQIESSLIEEEAALERLQEDKLKPEEINEALAKLSPKDKRAYFRDTKRRQKSRISKYTEDTQNRAVTLEEMDEELDNLKNLRRTGQISGLDYAKATTSLNKERKSLSDNQYRILKKQMIQQLGKNASKDILIDSLQKLKASSMTTESTQQIIREAMEMKKQKATNDLKDRGIQISKNSENPQVEVVKQLNKSSLSLWDKYTQYDNAREIFIFG